MCVIEGMIEGMNSLINFVCECIKDYQLPLDNKHEVSRISTGIVKFWQGDTIDLYFSLNSI